jgi:hypothetical protein
MFGSQTFINVVPGVLYEQEGGGMKSSEWGFDTGERRYLTHPLTSSAAYPQRNQADRVFTTMFVRDVIPRQHESGLYEITASFKGLKSVLGAVNKQRIRPDCDAQMLSIAVLSSGQSMNLLAPVPVDGCTREFVTTSTPTLNGVGDNTGGSFLPGTAGFSITVVPDPAAAPPPKNYRTGWVLDSRSWEDVAGIVYLVTEKYKYYYVIGI